MKSLLTVLLTVFSLSAFAQTCPAPSGNNIIIDSAYAVGSSISKETNISICYSNTTTSKITGLQFRLAFDTAAFITPTVTLATPDPSQYMQFHVTNNKIAVTIVYTGTDSNFTYTSNKLLQINFKHKADSIFQNLPNIANLTFDNSYPTVASTSNGLDTVLSKYNAGGKFIRPNLSFHGTFVNVTASYTKNLLVGLFKKAKTSSTWNLVMVDTTDIVGKFAFQADIDTTWYDAKVEVKGDTLSMGNVVTTADAQKVNRFVLELETPTAFDFP